MRRLGGFLAIAVALASMLIAGAPAGAATITEFEIEPGAAPTAHAPRYIEVGPDGNLWYTEIGAKPGIGRISPDGERLAPIPDPSGPLDLTVASDGTVYWTDEASALGRRLPNGAVSTVSTRGPAYAIGSDSGGGLRWGVEDPSYGSHTAKLCSFTVSGWGPGNNCLGGNFKGRLTGLALAPTGAIWTALYEGNVIQRYVSTESPTAIELPTGSGPARIVLGPDGNMWVTMFEAGAVDRFLPNGERKRFPLPAGSGPNDITVGPDNALWFTEYGSNRIGRMTTAGALTEYAIPTPNSHPTGITTGPDGALWFTEQTSGKIGRLVRDGVGGPAEGPAGGPGTGAAGAPRLIGSPTFFPNRFAVVGNLKARTSGTGKKAAPVGSVLKLSLSEAATVTAAIARKAGGRKAGSRCVAPAKAKPGAKKCTRLVSRGSFKAEAKDGANRIPFSGKVSGKKLAPGGYRATLTARDASGKVSESKTAGFTIVP